MRRAPQLSPNRRVQLRLGAALAIAEELAKRLERLLRQDLQIDESSDMTLSELGLDDAVLVTMEVAYGHLATEEALERYGIDGGRFLSVEIGTTSTSRVSREYITGGRFLQKGHAGDDYQSVEIDLWNGSVAAELHEGNRTLLTEIEDVLAHELTHAIDPKVRRADPYVSPFASRGGNLQGYLTQLVERKAFGQTMALRVLRCMAARGAARDDAVAFDECAAAAVDEPFLALSPKQQQRTLRDLYDAIQSVDIHEAIDVLAEHPAVGRRREREATRRRSAHDEWIARITADMRRDIAALLEEHGQVWLHSRAGKEFPTMLLSVRSGIAPAVALEFPGGDPDRPKRYRSVEDLLDDLPPLWRFPRESEDFWHDEPWTTLADAQEVSDGYHDIVGQFAMTANGSGFGSRDDFDAWLRWAKREDAAWKAEVQRVYEESGGVYIEDGADWYWLVYPSTRPDCRVQATRFARADDEPRGHYCAESIVALLGESPPVIFPRLGKDTSKTWRDVSVVRPMTYRNNGSSPAASAAEAAAGAARAAVSAASVAREEAWLLVRERPETGRASLTRAHAAAGRAEQAAKRARRAASAASRAATDEDAREALDVALAQRAAAEHERDRAVMSAGAAARELGRSLPRELELDHLMQRQHQRIAAHDRPSEAMREELGALERELGEARGLRPNARTREATWERWRDLVNMTPSEISSVLERYPEAGLSRSEARAQGVRSGRDSGRALVRMLRSGGRSYAQAERAWSDGDWEWAGRQVAFISRMRGARGALRDEHGEPTRKLLSLWIWGHCPEKTS